MLGLRRWAELITYSAGVVEGYLEGQWMLPSRQMMAKCSDCPPTMAVTAADGLADGVRLAELVDQLQLSRGSVF